MIHESFLSFKWTEETKRLASSAAQATMRFINQASNQLGRVAKVATSLSLISLSASFCSKIAYPLTVAGFVAQWIIPDTVQNLYKTLAELITHNFAQGCFVLFIAFLVLPATVLLAAFTYGVALNILWTGDKKQLDQYLGILKG